MTSAVSGLGHLRRRVHVDEISGRDQPAYLSAKALRLGYLCEPVSDWGWAQQPVPGSLAGQSLQQSLKVTLKAEAGQGNRPIRHGGMVSGAHEGHGVASQVPMREPESSHLHLPAGRPGTGGQAPSWFAQRLVGPVQGLLPSSVLSDP